MKKIISVIVVTLLLMLSVLTTFASNEINFVGSSQSINNQLSQDRENNVILVKFYPIENFIGQEKQYTDELRKVESWGINYIEALDVHVVYIDEMEKNPTAVMNRFKNSKFIEYVEPNFIGSLSVQPNDKDYSKVSTYAKFISAESGWTLITRSSVKIAIVDSGFYNHTDLPNPIKSYNVLTKDTNTTDNVGHGTNVAGTVGALGNNKTGTTGVVWDANIIPVKISDTSSVTTANVAAGVTWAIDQGAKIINLSLSFPSDSVTLKNAIDYAYNNGAVIVAATGNNATNTVNFPARYSNVLGIGGTTTGTTRYINSNYGTGLDVIASYTWYTTATGGTYIASSGTSFAAPQVSGLAALIWELAPNLTNTQVMQLIRDNTNRADGKWDSQTGYGTIDMGRTLAAAQALGGGKQETTTTPATPPPPAVAPTLTLNGKTQVELLVGERYVEPGFSAKDETGKDITSLVKVSGEPSTAFAGTYTVTYSVIASNGLSTTATRSVVVKEAPAPPPEVQKAPTISYIGSNPIILHLGSGTPYTEQGARAVCEKDGDISQKVVIEGNVNREVAGIYEVKYTVKNSQGLSASISRQVIVLASQMVQEPQQTYLYNEQAKKGDKPSLRTFDVKTDGAVVLDVGGLNKFSVGVTISDVNGNPVFQENFSANVARSMNLAAGTYNIASEVTDGSGNNKYSLKVTLPGICYEQFAQGEVPLAQLPFVYNTYIELTILVGILLIGFGGAVYLLRKNKVQ